VVSGKNQYFNAIETRRAAALPGSEPGHELFQPAEASWGFGKFALPVRNGVGARCICRRKLATDVAEFGNIRKFRH
jgi:hypothetical protein